jgi:hypothetical protein
MLPPIIYSVVGSLAHTENRMVLFHCSSQHDKQTRGEPQQLEHPDLSYQQHILPKMLAGKLLPVTNRSLGNIIGTMLLMNLINNELQVMRRPTGDVGLFAQCSCLLESLYKG